MILSLILTAFFCTVPPAWFCWLLSTGKFPHERGVPAPQVLYEVPDMSFDWRGLV